MTDPRLAAFSADGHKILQYLQAEVGKLQTGRANPAVFEHIDVDAYDQKMQMKAVASISAQDGSTIVIQPWDKTVLGAIEKAILTSNLGSQYLAALGDDETVEKVEPQVMEVVRGHFRPEFLNRLDDIILFHRLSAGHMGPIVDIQIARLGKLLEDRKIKLDLTDAARAWLGRVGYDPVYGARPLKRAVQKYLQDPLADKILAGEVVDGSTVKVDEGDGGLVIQPT